MVKGQDINVSKSIKYLGVFLDQNQTYQNEVKYISQKLKLAGSIETIYAIRDFFPIETCLLLLNALVPSQLEYSAILLDAVLENLLTTLEKQLNWGVKTCINRSKNDHSSDLKLNYNILPVQSSFDIKAINYYWKFKNLMIPAFKGKTVLPTAKGAK